jgi:REP element-mobilizing transposase RayT
MAEQVHNYIRLHARAIMSNHVHLLVSPIVAPVKFLQSVKGYTAREANRLLGRTGGKPNPMTTGFAIRLNLTVLARTSKTTLFAPV